MAALQPRFYVDFLSYWDAMGYIKNVHIQQPDTGTMTGYPIGLNPSNDCILDIDGSDNAGIRINFHKDITHYVAKEIDFVGMLGHNLAEPPELLEEVLYGYTIQNGGRYHLRCDFNRNAEQIYDDEMQTNTSHYMGLHSNMNSNVDTDINVSTGNFATSTDSGFKYFDYNGFSLWHANASTSRPWSKANKLYYALHIVSDGQKGYESRAKIKLNSVCLGRKYDMPHAADISISEEILTDGITRQKTKGGSELTNIRYSGVPSWGEDSLGNEIGPWEIYPPESIITSNLGNEFNVNAPRGKYRHGRKQWKLKFSYISEDDMFTAYAHPSEHPYTSASGITDDDNDIWDSANVPNETQPWAQIHPMWQDNSFMSRVWNLTGALDLAFVFVPNVETKNNGTIPADQHYICKFDQKSLRVRQKSFKVWDISVKIKEVW